MKSKRSSYIVITDNYLSVDMHFFRDGSRNATICCSSKDLINLGKEAARKAKLFRKKSLSSHFIHLSPEVSFFVEPREKEKK